jgi:prepilin-type N-terminal cleavage/methylation domain-containing protein
MGKLWSQKTTTISMNPMKIRRAKAADAGLTNQRGKRPVSCGGFTLMELMIVIALIGVLSGFGIPIYMSYRERVKSDNCKVGIKIIETAVKCYGTENNGYPDTLADVGLGDMTDPWGNPYQYMKIAGQDKKALAIYVKTVSWCPSTPISISTARDRTGKAQPPSLQR